MIIIIPWYWIYKFAKQFFGTFTSLNPPQWLKLLTGLEVLGRQTDDRIYLEGIPEVLTIDQTRILSSGSALVKFLLDFGDPDTSYGMKNVDNFGLGRPYISSNLPGHRDVQSRYPNINYDLIRSYVERIDAIPTEYPENDYFHWFDGSPLLVALFRGSFDVNPKFRNGINKLRKYIMNWFPDYKSIVFRKDLKVEIENILLSILYIYYASCLGTLNGFITTNKELKIYEAATTTFLPYCAFGDLPTIDGYEMVLVQPIHKKIKTITFEGITTLPKISSSSLTNQINSQNQNYRTMKDSDNILINEPIAANLIGEPRLNNQIIRFVKKIRVYKNNEIIPFLTKENTNFQNKKKPRYPKHTLKTRNIKSLILNNCLFEILDLSVYKGSLFLEELTIKNNKKLYQIKNLNSFPIKKLKIINDLQSANLSIKVNQREIGLYETKYENYGHKFELFSSKSFITHYLFSKIPKNLIELVICNCGLTEFPTEILHTVNNSLKKIDLSYNQITTIDTGNIGIISHETFPALENMDLSHNNIDTTSRTQTLDLSQRLFNITSFVLNLSHNKLRNVPVFTNQAGNRNVGYNVSLLLNNNYITEYNLTLELYYLDLSFNLLTGIEQNSINQITNLNISHNRIEQFYINQPFNRNNYTENFFEYLDISNNNSDIIINLFTNLNNIKYIDFSSNRQVFFNLLRDDNEARDTKLNSIEYLDLSNITENSVVVLRFPPSIGNNLRRRNDTQPYDLRNTDNLDLLRNNQRDLFPIFDIDVLKCAGNYEMTIEGRQVAVNQFFCEKNPLFRFMSLANIPPQGTRITLNDYDRGHFFELNATHLEFSNTTTLQTHLDHLGHRVKYLKYEIDEELNVNVDFSRPINNLQNQYPHLFLLNLKYKHLNRNNLAIINITQNCELQYLCMDNILCNKVIGNVSVIYMKKCKLYETFTFRNNSYVFLQDCEIFTERTQGTDVPAVIYNNNTVISTIAENIINRDNVDFQRIISQADLFVFSRCKNIYITGFDVREIRIQEGENLFLDCKNISPKLVVSERDKALDYFYRTDKNGVDLRYRGIVVRGARFIQDRRKKLFHDVTSILESNFSNLFK